MEPDTYTITTPIYYVNDLPHIGHIYTTVVADTIARYKRMRGFDVRFLTGTDEHGQKIERSARSQGITPKELADRVVGRYHELWRTLEITHDDFIRTTEDRHRAGVHALIARIRERGDIYKGSYEGWYCPGCEAFYPETQLVDGRCPDQGHPVERLAEESYFFRLSAYQQPLLDFYRAHPEFIRPQSRYNEVVRFVEGGLKDLSISRGTLEWGIPWPGDEGHVVYVWLDALTNYISALGFGADDDRLYQRYWPGDLHLVGKDILRFHCVYWPAFLMSAGLPLPKQVFGHGWWLRDERKMSKSTGNIVKPDALLARFGPDPLRYFLLREMTFGLDSNFSDEAFLVRYNADLANGLGNTASRVLAMSRRYFDGCTPPVACDDNVLRDKAGDVIVRYTDAMDTLELHRALEAIWELLSAVDVYINEKAPWSLFKQEGAGSQALSRVLYNGLESLRIVAVLLAPVMPGVSRRLLAQLGVGETDPGASALSWGILEASTRLPDGDALFPRVDIEAYFAEGGKVEEKPPVVEEKKTEADTQKVSVTPAVADVEDQISIDEFLRVRLKVGTVKHAERVPKSSKLMRLEVDLGEESLRQIVAGIAAVYEPEQLMGRQIVVVANLKPAKLMGVESRGMLLAASLEDGSPVLLGVEREIPPGSGVK